MSRAGSLSRNPDTLVKRNKNQLCDYIDSSASQVSWDPSIFQVITLAEQTGE